MNSELETVRQNVIECTKCELAKTRTNAAPGKGNFQSDVIFVGEAPGRNEDKNGEPFVGIAGQRLNLALDNAGILIYSWHVFLSEIFGTFFFCGPFLITF